MNTKIVKFNAIKSLPKEAVIAYGHFTTIHTGHIRYLRHAKKIGNELIVALLGDKDIKNTSNFGFKESDRADALSLLSIADYIVLLGNNNLKNLLEEFLTIVMLQVTESNTYVVWSSNFFIEFNQLVFG